MPAKLSYHSLLVFRGVLHSDESFLSCWVRIAFPAARAEPRRNIASRLSGLPLMAAKALKLALWEDDSERCHLAVHVKLGNKHVSYGTTTLVLLLVKSDRRK